MIVKNVIVEDFIQYRKPSMFIAMPRCSFKCDKECGKPVCQNSELATAPDVEIRAIELANRFYDNPITEAVCIGGLEPFDTFEEMMDFLYTLCEIGVDNCLPPVDIVIYTGYYPNEIKEKLDRMKNLFPYGNTIIIKFGRFIPDRPSKFDELLGVSLASDNQFAMRLEDVV